MKTFTYSAITVCLLCTFPALADDSNIERVVVTSDFRANDIQNVTASVSVIGADVIEVRQATNLDELLGVAPNVNFNSGASRGRFVQIRGIGERSQFSEPVNPSVGFLVDDFDFSGTAGVGTLFDVEQVEILRGPQATEFGAAGMAGTIKVKTVEANANQTNKLVFGAAQQNTWNLGIAHGGSLSENAFYRVAVQQHKSDGFVRNQFLNREDTDNLDELTARLKLKFIVSDSTTLDVNYQYFDIDNGYDAFSLDNDGVTRSDEPGKDTQETHAIGIKGTFNLAASDVFVTANHSTSDIVYGYDEDWTFVGFHPFEYSSTDYYFRERDVSTLDIRTVSNDASLLLNDTTQWLFGAFYRAVEESLLREYTFASADFTSEYEPTNMAVYAQTDSQLNDNLHLSLGLRVDRFDIDYTDSNLFNESLSETIVGGKAVLKYSIDNTSVYTSITRGYKAGGFNPDERVLPENRLYSAEYNWNYELGIKGTSEDGDVAVRFAVFYMDREDTQVSNFDVQIRDDGTPDFIDIVGNEDVGTNKGIEAELTWDVSDNTQIVANYGYLDASFEKRQLDDGSQTTEQRQAQAPKHSGHLSLTSYVTENLSVRVGADAKDNYRFSDGHDVEAPFTVLVNANIGYVYQDWTLSVYAKNLLDREHYTRGFGGFSNDPRDEYAFPEPYLQLGDGRQVGVSIALTY